MILVDQQILELVRRGTLQLDPFHSGERVSGQISTGLSSAGYDLRLGNKFLVPRLDDALPLDPKDPKSLSFETVYRNDHSKFLIPSRSFVLGHSVEYIKVPRFVIGLVFGKSTYARAGLIVNVTPLEPGWEGQLTIELVNPSPRPVAVYPGEGIAQLLFVRLGGLPYRDYLQKGGVYQGQREVTLPRVFGRSTPELGGHVEHNAKSQNIDTAYNQSAG